jgi:hypothetical protein
MSIAVVSFIHPNVRVCTVKRWRRSRRNHRFPILLAQTFSADAQFATHGGGYRHPGQPQSQPDVASIWLEISGKPLKFRCKTTSQHLNHPKSAGSP